MTLDLFEPCPQINLLPYEGYVQDYGLIYSSEQAHSYFEYLFKHLDWQQDQVKIYGKQITTSRKIAWYADQDYQYNYSGGRRDSLAWDKMLLEIRSTIEALLAEKFDSCLANLYENGSQGVGWHSDSDMPLNPQPTIASLSFGAARKFCFRHIISKEKVEMHLHSGQLIVMRGITQRYWQHALMKSQKIIEPRVSLTFRQFTPTL